jgi:hypothetical protein
MGRSSGANPEGQMAAGPSVPVPWRSAERLGIRPTIGIDFRKTRSLNGDWP